jgi:hypothetical protein
MQGRTALFGTTLIAAALIIALPRLSLSPGPMTRGHADIANDCLGCHTPLRGLPTEKCIHCHRLDSIGIGGRAVLRPTGADTALTGMHNSFAKTDCLECHTDHAGPDPVNATRGFSHEALGSDFRQRCTTCHDGNRPVDDLHRQAGDDCGACHTTTEWKPATFDHQKFGMRQGCTACHAQKRPADDLHRQVGDDCGACHTTTEWKPATFDHRKFGMRQGCTACHERKRPTDELHRQMGSDCGACHTTNAWKPATFEHNQYFVLDRDHRTSCGTCHTESGSYKSYTCYGCHEHSQSRILAKHEEEGIANLRDCVRCHRSADEHEGGHEGGREHHDDDD